MQQNGDAGTVHEATGFCWLCGRTPSLRPEGFHSPYYLQVAHIASGGGRAVRANDRRAVGLLCSLCHLVHVSDSDRLQAMNVGGQDYPTIDERHTIFLKGVMDEEYYDLEYLSTIWIGNLPEPEPPPAFWSSQLYKRTGILL